MANPSYLVSTFLMGVILLVVGGAVVRSREWRTPSERVYYPARREAVAERTGPLGLAVAIAILVVAFGGAVLVAGTGPAGGVNAGLAFIAALVVLLGGFLVWGGYFLARSRGLGYAPAVGVGAWILGLLVLVVVVVTLMTGP